MNIILTILSIAFLITVIRNTLYQVFLWQLKEYRLDRMIAHLGTWQGKRMIFGPISVLKWLLIIAYFASIPILPIIFIVYLVEVLKDLGEINIGWKKPVFTLKATTISIFVIGAYILIILWLLTNHPTSLGISIVILDILLFFIIAIIILILAIPTMIQRMSLSEDAKIIIAQHPKLITIGITGSYGKTSTKEFLAGILSTKYKVLKTMGSQNTEIGIAKTIIDSLKDQQIFVCEMAAYKKGEIKSICDMVKPKIGIITAINEQHVELFGSLENTIAAKFELIEALPKKGLAVFNGNNANTRQLAEKAKKMPLITVIYQYTDELLMTKSQFSARMINVLPDRLDFEIQVNGQKITTSAPLLGVHNVENILAAVVVASHLGMSLDEISQAVKKLQPPEMTMKPYPGPSGATLIDDTFNTNPDGVLAAINYMKVYTGKKILVFQPMIELGEASLRLHQEVGEFAAKNCDLIFLTNRNYYESIVQGADLVENSNDKFSVLPLDQAIKIIKENLSKESVVVFEGKEAARYLMAFR